ncbi:MAG TPA: hypothetical protein VLW51_03835 [Solirubrobacteraceae bacterium]|nr:hypothetical protein [Solirubrobacteraceae bacterium]
MRRWATTWSIAPVLAQFVSSLLGGRVAGVGAPDARRAGAPAPGAAAVEAEARHEPRTADRGR